MRHGAAEPAARLFVACWPGPATRRAIVDWRDLWRWPGGTRPVPDAQLHLTLHFIGAVPRARVPEVAEGLQMRFEGFVVGGGSAEVWRGGVAVLRLAEEPPALRALHEALGRAIDSLGLPVERRRFTPHVTLARHAAGAWAPQAPAALTWPVRGYRLVESLPQGRGYRAVRVYR
ncbi:MAG: RNA 2',3'-cyclic phosphodiesterase [Rubrivivax sp.]|nr:RNA 2',3'-cyclic phosphodiesterase [Rubrivivax sp.]